MALWTEEAPQACCGGTHPPRTPDLLEAATLAERLIDLLLDGTEGERWNQVLETVLWVARPEQARLVGNALRAEAGERLAELVQSQEGSRWTP